VGGLNAAQGAVSVWDFNDGVPAVCRMNIAGHRRVDLNFSPLPTRTTDTVTGDAALLAKNALLYVSGGLAPAPSPLKLASLAVGAPDTNTVNLFNRDPPSIIDIAITGAAITVNAAEFSVESPTTFPFSIVSGAHAPFKVHFTPTQTGVRLGELTLTTSDPDGPTIRIPLQGTCYPPALTLIPNNLVFATTDIGSQSSLQLVVISNAGFTDLSVYNVALTAGSSDFSLDATNVVSPLAAGANTYFSVRFTPSTAGPLTGTVTVASNDPSAPTKAVVVSGTGRDPDTGADAMADASSDDDAADGSTIDTTGSDGGPPDAPGIVDTSSGDEASDDAPDASVADTVVDQTGPPDAVRPDASSPDGSAPDARDAAADLSTDSLAGSDGATSDAPRMDTATRDAPELDASRDGSGTGGRLDAASDGSDGTTPSDDDRGCGCRAASGASTHASKWSLLLIVAAAMLRKRARAGSAGRLRRAPNRIGRRTNRA
jgi:hypothetical protein